MAQKFLVPIDHNNLESYNFRFQNLGADPGSPVKGNGYYSTAIDAVKYYNGTSWVIVDPAKVADAYIPLAKVNGAAPLASPTFTGLVITPAGSSSQAGGLKLTAGTLKTTPVAGDAGSIEFNGTSLSFIDSTGTRKTLGVSGAGIQSVTLTQPSAGFTITSSGTASDPIYTFALSDDLVAVESISTTGFVQRTASNTWSTVASTGTGNVVLAASPTFTGVPLAPTAAVDTNTTQIATTAFVLGQAASATPAALGTASTGSSTRFARGDHVHAMPTLNAVTAPTADVTLNNFKITNLADPVADTDASNKRYVDNAIAGIPWKDEVIAATVGSNITLSGGAPNTLDGVSLAANNRILVKDQTTTSQNGIYVISTLGTGSNGTWTRATDADTDAEMRGMAVFVVSGTTLAGNRYVSTNTGPITVGTTGITFALFGASTSYTASNGVQLVGSDLSVKLDTSSGLSTSASGLKIDTSVVARKYSVAIGDGSSTTITVTHNLNTRDVHVNVYDASTYTGVITDWVANGVNTVQITFATAPTSGQYRTTIIG